MLGILDTWWCLISKGRRAPLMYESFGLLTESILWEQTDIGKYQEPATYCHATHD